MKSTSTKYNLRRLIIFGTAFCALVTVPFLAKAQPATSVNIVNNSGREIRHIYLSHVDANDWGSNQLGDSVISSGQSYSLSNVACDAQQVKVIAEDQDGCFLSAIINCGETATWTVNNDTARDCGN
jgi:hypothetical protein